MYIFSHFVLQHPSILPFIHLSLHPSIHFLLWWLSDVNDSDETSKEAHLPPLSSLNESLVCLLFFFSHLWYVPSLSLTCHCSPLSSLFLPSFASFHRLSSYCCYWHALICLGSEIIFQFFIHSSLSSSHFSPSYTHTYCPFFPPSPPFIHFLPCSCHHLFPSVVVPPSLGPSDIV